MEVEESVRGINGNGKNTIKNKQLKREMIESLSEEIDDRITKWKF